MNRRDRPRRRQAAGLLPLLLVAALAGCAGIPDSGPVVPGRPLGDVPRAPLLIPGVAPKAGAVPEEVVRGFLRAAADISGDRTVARMYLTGVRQDSWLPDASVVIYGADSQLTAEQSSLSEPPRATRSATSAAVPSPVSPAPPATPAPAPAGTADRTSPGVAGSVARASLPPDGARVTVTVEVPVQARVDSDGEYRIAAPGDLERRSFGLVARAGEWRIDYLPDGSILTKADFDTTYSDVPVYFPDPTGNWLVPDMRWFPIGAPTATVLVKAVLGGPAGWLAPAVVTGAPAGTRLTASSVPVQQGTALVDLTREARQADPVHRQMLYQQLRKTLSVLALISPTPVDGVTITVEGRAFDIPRSSGPAVGGRPSEPNLPRLSTSAVVSGSPLVVDKGKLMLLSGEQLTPVEGLDALNRQPISWPAAATDGSAYAALAGGNVLLYAVAGGEALPLVSGLGSLTPPSFDPLGWVWTASTSGLVRAGRPGKETVAVTVEGWPAGLSVTSLRISRDGTRALVSGNRNGAGELFVCAVIRDRAQAPVRLGPPKAVLPDLVTAQSAAWLDQRRVVVLGRRGVAAEEPWVVEVGGDAEPTAASPGAIGVTAGNGDIYLATTAGTQQLSVVSWRNVSSAHWPALPG
ncbi:MAG TPA: LpqB family beta-propeller domain-containing protein [Kineosporiaceae bacterium]|nr:LpqB family beta-propeller domain-containing protein [Kineosporiaceae bacterium]